MGKLTALLLVLITVGCGTLKKKIAQYKIQSISDKADDRVSYLPPSSSFQKQASENLDALWFNPKTKSSISYFSNCSKVSPKQSAQEIEKDILSALEGMSILKTKLKNKGRYTSFQIKAGKNQTHKGSIFIRKNKSCFYVLNFMTNSASIFEKETRIFNQFIKTFQIPNDHR